jgi:hypothetical protein
MIYSSVLVTSGCLADFVRTHSRSCVYPVEKGAGLVTRPPFNSQLNGFQVLVLCCVVGSWDLNRPGCNAVRGRTLTTQTSNLD